MTHLNPGKIIYLQTAILILLLFSISALPSYVESAEGRKAWLENLRVRDSEGSIVIDTKLKGAFTQDITEAVVSGTPTRFKFLIQLRKKRKLWFDKKIREYEISHTVVYDVLKKEYLVTRLYPDGNEENLSTAVWYIMEEWMTELNSIHLAYPEIKDKSVHYFLKIKAEMKCIKIPFPINYLLAFISLWNFDTPWTNVPLNISIKPQDNIRKDLYL